MSVDTAAETYDQIKNRVVKGVDDFARGYSGKWQWALGWGQNCHTFQQALKTKTKMHYQSATGWLSDPAVAQAKKQAVLSAAANLKLVAGKPWFVCQHSTLGTIDPGTADDGPELTLPASKEFAVTGQKRRIGGIFCQQVVTRDGQIGWVSEHELQHFTNM